MRVRDYSHQVGVGDHAVQFKPLFSITWSREGATNPSEGPQMTILAIYFYNFAIAHEHGEFRFYVEILFENEGLRLDRDWFLPQCRQAL